MKFNSFKNLLLYSHIHFAKFMNYYANCIVFCCRVGIPIVSRLAKVQDSLDSVLFILLGSTLSAGRGRYTVYTVYSISYAVYYAVRCKSLFHPGHGVRAWLFDLKTKVTLSLFHLSSRSLHFLLGTMHNKSQNRDVKFRTQTVNISVLKC